MTSEQAKKLKQKLPFTIKEVGDWDATELIQKVKQVDENTWKHHMIRQRMNNKQGTHRNTNTLEILWHKQALTTGDKGLKNKRNYNLLDFDKTIQSLKPIYQQVFGKGDFHRILITRLQPQSDIPIHQDGGIPLMEAHRTHLPLVTDKQVEFLVEDTKQHLQVGKIYEINNAKTHAVSNPTKVARVHLIIDYLPDTPFLKE